MRNTQSGFSLLELMAAVATVGVLSAVVIPSFLTSKPKAQTADAHAELAKIEAAAKNYYLAEGKFPGSTVTALPGPNGAACSNAGKKFPVSSLWSSDPVWSNLDFHVDQASGWTYHFETTGPTTARIRAVGDPDCDGRLTTIQVDVVADVAMDGSNDGEDTSGQVAHSWAPQSAQEAGVYPGSMSTLGGGTSGGTTNLGGTSTTSGAGSTTSGAPSTGTIASNGANGSSTTNTISSTTTSHGDDDDNDSDSDGHSGHHSDNDGDSDGHGSHSGSSNDSDSDGHGSHSASSNDSDSDGHSGSHNDSDSDGSHNDSDNDSDGHNTTGGCNWGNGQGQGQGCVNGVANGDTNNTNNDDGHPGMTGGTNTPGNGNGNGKK